MEEAAAGQGIGRRLTAELTERFFDWLDAPAGVIASMDVPTSVSRALEQAAIIDDEEISEMVISMARRTWR